MRIFWPEFSREELIKRIREGIKSVMNVLPITKVVLFGSYARQGILLQVMLTCW